MGGEESRDENELHANDDKQKELNMQDARIQELAEKLAKLEEENTRAKSSKGGRLKPIERQREGMLSFSLLIQ